MKDTTILKSIAVVGIVVIECFAIHNGIDGVALTASIASLAAIWGYHQHKGTMNSEKK